MAAIAKFVGMRPLERSLEKLDDVKKKKLAEMIGDSGGGLLPGVSASVLTASGNLSGSVVAGSSHVRKSAASMLSGKKSVLAAPANKQTGPVNTGGSKKGEGVGQVKALGSVEHEDSEPAEMSHDEIESRIGSLLKEDTISQPKSGVWKERLKAIVSLKQEVEGLSDLDAIAMCCSRLE